MGCLGGIKTEFQLLNRMSCQDKRHPWNLISACLVLHGSCPPTHKPWDQCWAWRESLRPLVSRMAPQVNSVPAENTVFYRDGYSLPLTRAGLFRRHPSSLGTAVAPFTQVPQTTLDHKHWDIGTYEPDTEGNQIWAGQIHPLCCGLVSPIVWHSARWRESWKLILSMIDKMWLRILFRGGLRAGM